MNNKCIISIIIFTVLGVANTVVINSIGSSADGVISKTHIGFTSLVFVLNLGIATAVLIKRFSLLSKVVAFISIVIGLVFLLYLYFISGSFSPN